MLFLQTKTLKMKHIYRKIKAVTFILFTGITFSVNAQNTIKGKIVDEKSREPLENVSVISSANAAIHTLTDAGGNFVIENKTNVQNITVSTVGYLPATIAVNNNANITIALKADLVNLKDIILQASTQQKFATISKIDLDLKPVRSTQELLRIVPGLFIAQHAGGGKAEQIFLRGFDCDHGTDVQVSVDGMPVNMVSHAHGQGYADTHFIIAETVNNIDFGAGPYYTDHGNLNTAGYVAFSTFKNIPTSLVKIEAGNFNTFRTLVMLDLLKKNKDKQSAYIASEFNYTDGPTVSKQAFNRFNILSKYNVAFSQNTSLSFSASAFKSKWNASGQVPTRAVEDGTIDRYGSIDNSEGGNTERYNANLTLKHTFKNNAVLDNQVFYNRYKFSLFSDFTFFLKDPVNGDELNQAEARNIYGYSSILKKKYFFNNSILTSSEGIGLRYDATNDSRLAHVVKRQFLNYVKLGNIKELNSYAFTQQQLSVDKWLFDAGVRLDYFTFNYFDKLVNQSLPSQQKTIVSPKLNIQYSINKNVQIYVKTGKGFHSNDSRGVTANNGRQILPAAYGADIGLYLKPTKNLFLNIAAWYLKLDQEFVYVGDDGNVEPSGATRRQGIDVIGRYQFTKNLFANVNINFTKPRAIGQAKGNDYIPLAPTATTTGGIYYKQKLGLNGGISYRYLKRRPANEDNSIVAKGYFVADASINYTKTKYEIGLAVDNIFNVKWNEAQFATTSQLKNETAPVEELNYTPGNPFSFRAKLVVFF